jgi:hypothetical protein
MVSVTARNVYRDGYLDCGLVGDSNVAGGTFGNHQPEYRTL